MSEPEVKRLLEKFEESERWFREHYDELAEKYENMLLAIKDKQVISASAEIEGLLEDLKAKKQDIASVYITSIPPKGVAFII